MTAPGQEFRYVCCFCGESVEGGEPREIVLPLEDGGSQHLLCHDGCVVAYSIRQCHSGSSMGTERLPRNEVRGR